MVVTVSERKAAEAARRAAAAAAVAAALAAYARACGGRYWLYGSAAEGRMRYDSDIDLLVDFPGDLHAEAWRHAEAVCAAHDLPADIMPLGWMTPTFKERVLPKARSLS